MTRKWQIWSSLCFCLLVHVHNNNRPENDEVKDHHPSYPNHDQEEQVNLLHVLQTDSSSNLCNNMPENDEVKFHHASYTTTIIRQGQVNLLHVLTTSSNNQPLQNHETINCCFVVGWTMQVLDVKSLPLSATIDEDMFDPPGPKRWVNRWDFSNLSQGKLSSLICIGLCSWSPALQATLLVTG